MDLRSDTVTKPCERMRAAIASAEVGDDVYQEDPTVNKLEALAAEILGKQTSVFVSSGTQSNLLAMLSHCHRGDEYIVGNQAHVYKYEGGGAAALGGIQANPLPMEPNGTMDLERLSEAIRPDDPHFAKTRLICLENTFSGYVLPKNYPSAVKKIGSASKLSLHLDGARLFNAAVSVDSTAESLSRPFDTVSFCLSKGLGAPVGSILAGPSVLINKARRWRKVVGGGMRQAGILAAAGIYALKNNINRLKEDHEKANEICDILLKTFGEETASCATNMVHLNLSTNLYNGLADHLRMAGVTVGRPRWVMHQDIRAKDVRKLTKLIRSFKY